MDMKMGSSVPELTRSLLQLFGFCRVRYHPHSGTVSKKSGVARICQSTRIVGYDFAKVGRGDKEDA